MDTEAAEALEGSIQKWESIAAGKKWDMGEIDCPLCKLFHNLNAMLSERCAECPVKLRSGFANCLDTPYSAWILATNSRALSLGRFADTPELKALAQADLDFLKSLREPAP